jgi:ATP-dependent Lon protease
LRKIGCPLRGTRTTCSNRNAFIGNIGLGCNVVPVESLAETLQMVFDSGAKRILIPMISVTAILTVPGELFAKFQTGFYSEPVDAVFKALGVD